MRILLNAEDVTPEMDAQIEDCLDWFQGEPRLSTEVFIDRFAKDYGGEDWDIESYGNPAANRIMKRARQLRKEQRQ